MSVSAVQVIRKMRGASQSQLVLGSDKNLWIVKFQNNPQHIRVLANEMIATRLAASIGLDVPETDVIDVQPELIADAPEMFYELGQGLHERYAPGLQFGSQFVGGLMPGTTVDYLPDEALSRVSNLDHFPGMLCFDKWTCNCDWRQAVFTRRTRQQSYKAIFIDQGFCFNAGNWDFPDSPLRGIYARSRVYARVTGWNSFEPWLSRIEAIQPSTLEQIAGAVPPEWYGSDQACLDQLIEQLLKRRSRIRELITEFRYRDPGTVPFPNWI